MPRPRRRFRKPTVLIVDGALVPTRDHQVAEQSKNYRYSTNHQVVIDADTGLVVAFGRPLPGNRNDRKAWELSGAKAAVGRTTVIADGGYRGTGLVIPYHREKGQTELHPRRVTKKHERPTGKPRSSNPFWPPMTRGSHGPASWSPTRPSSGKSTGDPSRETC